MKIAITGHSAGIGQALAKIYTEGGHEVIGLSRRNGFHIRSIPKILGKIEPCDVFINNAQSGYGQAELLEAVWQTWQGQDKQIINISTMMTNMPTSNSGMVGLEVYRVQKRALEELHWQLRAINNKPEMILVKPGHVGTQPTDIVGKGVADVDVWANAMVNAINSIHPSLSIAEIAIRPR